MPPKKQKSKVKKSKVKKSPSNKEGIKINININQPKKSSSKNKKTSSTKKPLTVYKTLPAYSSMPQGSSYLGTHIPLQNIQQPTYNQPSIAELGKEVFNNLMLESQKRENSAYGFGGFQNSTSQVNQLVDGNYSRKINGDVILLRDYNPVSDYVDENVYDDPTTNQIITYNKLENKGQRLPSTNENSIVELNNEEKRDNDLDNLILHEKKTKVEKEVEKDLNEELIEEEDVDLGKSFSDIRTQSGQEQRLLELSLEEKEKRIAGVNLTPDKKRFLKVNFNVPNVPSRSASNQELKDYITTLNRLFDTDYNINFKGKDAKEKLFRTIRLALITEYDNYN